MLILKLFSHNEHEGFASVVIIIIRIVRYSKVDVMIIRNESKATGKWEFLHVNKPIPIRA